MSVIQKQNSFRSENSEVANKLVLESVQVSGRLTYNREIVLNEGKENQKSLGSIREEVDITLNVNPRDDKAWADFLNNQTIFHPLVQAVESKANEKFSLPAAIEEQPVEGQAEVQSKTVKKA